MKTHNLIAWTAAVLTWGVGDVATTAAGLLIPGVVETHPLLSTALHLGGIPALVGIKAAALCVGYGVWSWMDDPSRFGIPLGLTIVGVWALANNAAVLYAAFFGPRGPS